MKTFTARPVDIDRRWLLVDADGVTLGRLASQVATVLKGKHKPIYTPHMDTGDHVVVINAAKVALSGAKPAAAPSAQAPGAPPSNLHMHPSAQPVQREASV